MSKKLCSVDQFGKPAEHGDFLSFYQSLPNFLGASQLKALAKRIASGGTVVAAIGGHVIKSGCSRYVVDMIKKGQITDVVMNGAAAIHDVEIAISGETSEDVEAGVADGTFGCSKDTVEFFHYFSDRCVFMDWPRGYGANLRWFVRDWHQRSDRMHLEHSIIDACLSASAKLYIVMAVGTDTLFLHEGVNTNRLLEASAMDMKWLQIDMSAQGDRPLTWLNIGSAVILPEVFLKAYQYAKIRGKEPKDLHKANLDMIRGQYRPTNNVLAMVPGTNYDLTGHHEIMLPLLHAAVQMEASTLKNGYATTVATNT